MNERQRALELALTQIEKQFGKGSIMKLGEASAKLQVEVIPPGSGALGAGQRALESAGRRVRSSAVAVIVIDSVAARVPRAELEGEMGDAHLGLQARLMSQPLRKLVGAISKSHTTVVFINQIREKIGVMFGCFHYSARVVLADGSTMKIGKIVNQRLPVEVLSYGAASGTFPPAAGVNWFDNRNADYFLQFEVEGGPFGRGGCGATPPRP